MNEDAVRLRDERVKRGLTLRKAAHILDLSPTKISYIEKGKLIAPPWMVESLIARMQDAVEHPPSTPASK